MRRLRAGAWRRLFFRRDRALELAALRVFPFDGRRPETGRTLCRLRRFKFEFFPAIVTDDAGRHGRHDTIAGKLLDEQVQEARVRYLS